MLPFTQDELRRYMTFCIVNAHQTDKSLIKGPYVGALVLDSDKRVAGIGYKKFMDDTSLLLHAERVALEDAFDRSEGGFLFTTLEPCSRVHDSQIMSSCSELIVQRGIRGVIIGLPDRGGKFPSYAGMNYLHRHGVEFVHYRGLERMIAYELMPRSCSATICAVR